jgi:hypothetical protein
VVAKILFTCSHVSGVVKHGASYRWDCGIVGFLSCQALELWVSWLHPRGCINPEPRAYTGQNITL